MLKRLIFITVGAVLITGSISAIVLYRMPDTYTATAYLVMNPIPLTTQDFVPSILTDRGDVPYRVSFVTLNDIPPFPAPDYEQIYMSDEIVEQVLLYVSEKDEYKKEKLSRTKLRKSMNIKTRIFFQGANQIQYQRIIVLSFTSTNPELSAEVCNYWVELGMKKIEELRQNPLKEGLEYIEQTLAEKENQLNEKTESLKKLESSVHIPSLEQRIQDLENQVTNFRIQKANIDLEIEKLTKEIELTSNLDSPIDNEQIPNNEESLPKIVNLQKEIQIKNAEKESLQKLIEQMELELGELRRNYADKKQEKLSLENEIMLIRQNLNNLKVTRDNVLINLAAKSQSELRFASKSLTPRQKSGPPRTLYLACIIVLTIVVAPSIYIGTLVLNYYLSKLEKDFLPSA
ncbi:MAG: hypothetical protein N3G21_00315 [Candidatus Hydrogenedentes bacterium]|nr:hypothetical protein [Candidatus Hydrogenedentota bacterium]